MIRGTTADCKIKSIVITDSTATITCIIFSSSPARKHQAFKFYLKDKDDKLYYISYNIYWIDRINNYNNDILNVDVNQYLEVVLKVDITNQNKGKLIDNKWVRECNLILRNVNEPETSFSWVSEDLTLVSKRIEIPEIYDLDIYSDKDYGLHIAFRYKYKSQQDFNYNNKNLYTTINVVSVHTNNILESMDVEEENSYSSKVVAKLIDTYDSVIKIQIQLKNSRGDVLLMRERIYSPLIRQTSTFIKTHEGIKRVLAFYIKERDILED